MTVLNIMWTAIFCMAFGAWLYYSELIAVHLLLAAGTLITGAILERAASLARRRPCFTVAAGPQFLNSYN
jgi:hypothetical protein